MFLHLFSLLCVYLCRCLPPNTLLPRNLPSIHTRTPTTLGPLRQTWHIMIATNEQQSLWRGLSDWRHFENTSIPEVFKERTWTKLLNPGDNVYKEIIREFFSNATVDGDHINCWVRHKEFVIKRESIQEFLEVRPPSQPIAIKYDDRLDSLEPMVELFHGSLKKKSMNTIPFNAEMRTLAYVMIHNLCLATNLTTLS